VGPAIGEVQWVRSRRVGRGSSMPGVIGDQVSWPQPTTGARLIGRSEKPLLGADPNPAVSVA
jgi:hypothetical protein